MSVVTVISGGVPLIGGALYALHDTMKRRAREREQRERGK